MMEQRACHPIPERLAHTGFADRDRECVAPSWRVGQAAGGVIRRKRTGGSGLLRDTEVDLLEPGHWRGQFFARVARGPSSRKHCDQNDQAVKNETRRERGKHLVQ